MKAKKILVCGLSGSGKSTLSEPLSQVMDAVWLNADKIRKEFDDWDFSKEGRLRQATRMKFLADVIVESGKSVIADFICPLEETRKYFDADVTIWIDTIKNSKFADTDAIFEKPSQVDFHITEWVDFDDSYCYNNIYKKIQLGDIDNRRDCGEYKDGERHGHYLRFREDGKLEEEMWLDNGRMIEKIQHEYYNTKQLKTSIPLDENHQPHGTQKWYSPDGRLMNEQEYKHGVKHGKEITYAPEGIIGAEYTFNNGVLDGPYFRYWDDGTTWDEGEFKDGILHGKPDDYFTGNDSERIYTDIGNTTSMFSLLSNLKRNIIGDEVPGVINRKYFTGKTEVFENVYPTRTDVSNIENEKTIIPIFGDSFIFGHGLPREYELGTVLRKECPDILFPNFGCPGAGNNKIVNRLEKWTNDEHAHKTKSIIIAMSSLYRFDFFVDGENPDSFVGVNPFHKKDDIETGNYTMRSYNISAQWDHVADELDNEVDAEILPRSSIKKLKKVVTGARDGIVRYHTTYANAYLKNIETNLRRIDWITRAMNWNIVLVKIGGWHTELNPEDSKIINRYIKDMNIEDRRCDVIHMRDDQKTNIIDNLDCGHWGHETTQYLAEEIKNIL